MSRCHDTRLIVYSSLFPSGAAPNAGAFIRERAFRLGVRVPISVVAPQPWSPIDWLIRIVRPAFRVPAPAHETMNGVEVHRPRFLSVPGVLKRLDGRLMAACTLRTMRRVARNLGATAIDAHFLYPDGYAAVRIGRRLGLPVTVTLRGSKDQRLLGTDREPLLREAAAGATRLISVTRSLAIDVATRLVGNDAPVEIVGNGVDMERFAAQDRTSARAKLAIPNDAKVILGVGNLIDLKGFHRVIPLLPRLRKQFPGLLYLIVGADTAQGEISTRLRELARAHGVGDCVRLCGAQPQHELAWYYSAADVFALATEYEGWANVFLEAMASGLPVVATRVGGNAEVVPEPACGTLVDFWDADAFARAIEEKLLDPGDRNAIIAYAASNSWDRRVDQLVEIHEQVSRAARGL